MLVKRQYVVAFLLVMLVFVSSLLLVQSRHRVRQLTAETEKLETQMRRLDAEGAELEARRGLLSQPTRVEDIARSQLKMEKVSSSNGRLMLFPINGAARPPP